MNRRGFVLVATVVVVAAAILVATGAIFAARATTANSRASDSDRRLRMAALDGVALVADALHNARTDVLAGKTPTIEPMLLVAGDDLDRIEVSAMPLFDGEFVQSEGAKSRRCGGTRSAHRDGAAVAFNRRMRQPRR